MIGQLILDRQIDGHHIGQREDDGYVNATALCKAAGKQWNDYWRLDGTKEFIAELSSSTGIPVNELCQSRQGRPANGGGTWAHPDLAVNLAQWCSPRFAVMVSKWVRELLTTGRVDLGGGTVIGQYVTAEQVARMMDSLRDSLLSSLGSRPASLPGPSHPGPYWTVETRLIQRHPEWRTTREQRAKIRRTANYLVRTILHQHVDYLAGLGSPCVWYSGQVQMLDQAVDLVHGQAVASHQKDGLGLYAGMANGAG